MKRALPVVLVLVLLCACSSKKEAVRDTPQGSNVVPSASRHGATGDPRTTPRASDVTPAHPATAAQARRAPAPGVYTYRQSGSFTSSTRGTRTVPPQGTLTVGAPTDAGGAIRQVQTRKVDEDDTRRYTYLLFRDRVALEHATVSGFDCTLSPALKVLPEPAAVGQSWRVTSSCNEAPQISFTLDARIARSERRSVGVTTVDTLVVVSTLKVEAGAFSQTQDATTWVSPANHLIVRSVSHVSSSFGSGDLTEELVSLTPARA
jgi:hypothetical protein